MLYILLFEKKKEKKREKWKEMARGVFPRADKLY
jgi:hypothetical protein